MKEEIKKFLTFENNFQKNKLVFNEAKNVFFLSWLDNLYQALNIRMKRLSNEKKLFYNFS